MLSTLFFFFFNDTATTEIYTLSLHDALPISAFAPVPPKISSKPKRLSTAFGGPLNPRAASCAIRTPDSDARPQRSEEHTSELQSHVNLVCRLLLEKKKKIEL